MLSYGAKLVNEGYISGPDLLAFIVYQLTLGSLLSVSVSRSRRNRGQCFCRKLRISIQH